MRLVLEIAGMIGGGWWIGQEMSSGTISTPSCSHGWPQEHSRHALQVLLVLQLALCIALNQRLPAVARRTPAVAPHPVTPFFLSHSAMSSTLRTIM